MEHAHNPYLRQTLPNLEGRLQCVVTTNALLGPEAPVTVESGVTPASAKSSGCTALSGRAPTLIPHLRRRIFYVAKNTAGRLLALKNPDRHHAGKHSLKNALLV